MGATARGRPRARARRRPSPAVRRRRRALALILGVALVALLATVIAPQFRDAVREITLPLRHEDIIRQQAADKRLDPALLAAVIYAESRFSDRTSVAGARGLMQITPDTARYIARRSGGTAFRLDDLGTPQVNIAYGSWFLRYLIDRYAGDEVLGTAAYNAGLANVDRWLRDASRDGRAFRAEDIPFPETRAYVERVLDARERYRSEYRRELGL